MYNTWERVLYKIEYNTRLVSGGAILALVQRVTLARLQTEIWGNTATLYYTRIIHVLAINYRGLILLKTISAKYRRQEER
jgi:hypothetical protein